MLARDKHSRLFVLNVSDEGRTLSSSDEKISVFFEKW
jgi:hypothetical protein